MPFCLYAGTTQALLAQIDVPADGTKWQTISDKGYKYKDKDGTEDGIQKILVKGSDQDKSRALLKGKGTALPDMTVPFQLPVVAELRNNATGVCFQGTFNMLDGEEERGHGQWPRTVQGEGAVSPPRPPSL